jgi:hypothetical protein
VRVGDDGVPKRLLLGGAWHEVTPARLPWRVDQLWWRAEPASRMYYRVAPEDGPSLTIYQDLIDGQWFRQEY